MSDAEPNQVSKSNIDSESVSREDALRAALTKVGCLGVLLLGVITLLLLVRFLHVIGQD